MEKMLKAKELAEALNVNVETVRRWTRDGIIPHIKLGASKRYSLELFEHLADLKDDDGIPL